jgi:L-alanine-DL-glutamate epimerase-like enolase superfamily enzyme
MIVRMKITRLQMAECRVPLPHVLKLGSTQITTRNFVAIRIETDAGITGEALGYTRGTPLLDALDMVGRQLIGMDPLMRGKILAKLENSNIPGRASFTRAVSLLDIACWDILAKHARLPLYALLGGYKKSAGVTAVAGYYMDLRSLDDIVDEVARLHDSGYARIKIMLKGDDNVFDLHYAKAVSDRVPGACAADAHWSWSSVTDAARFCRQIDDLGLNFIEDPFAAADWELTHQLQNMISTPIAAGEDVLGTRTLKDLVEGIGILRVDATTCGGVTGAIEAVHHASAAGRNVFPHVFAFLHIHFACAFPCVEGVEYIPEDSGADPLGALMKNPPVVRAGQMSVSDDPGVGIVLDWKSIEKIASRTVVI